MIRTIPPAPPTEHPVKILKHLLVFAIARLTALGDLEAIDRIMAELPPVEKKG
jgi:hypothetical protein